MGPLPTLVAQADRQLYNVMRRDAVVRGLIREEVPEYPPIALREALANAVGHRDFAAEDRLWISQFRPLGLSADAKVALVFARRTGAITNEQLRALRPLDRETSRETLQDLVARGLLEAFGRGRGTGYRLSELAVEARTTATLGEQLMAVLNHARRSGVVVNADVRGLLGVGAAEARTMLEALVARGLLQPEGERRGRRYLTVRQAEDEV